MPTRDARVKSELFSENQIPVQILKTNVHIRKYNYTWRTSDAYFFIVEGDAVVVRWLVLCLVSCVCRHMDVVSALLRAHSATSFHCMRNASWFGWSVLRGRKITCERKTDRIAGRAKYINKRWMMSLASLAMHGEWRYIISFIFSLALFFLAFLAMSSVHFVTCNIHRHHLFVHIYTLCASIASQPLQIHI